MRPGLYLHALRVARWRQLRARAARPFARRRFPGGDPPGDAGPVPAAEELWRSPAFEPGPPPDPATRLGAFHAQYGEDVLGAARAGDTEQARALVDRWIDDHPPRDDDAWHPYPLSTRVGNWVAALTLAPELASPRLSASLWRQLRRLEANVEDDVLGNHVIRNARALVLGGAAFDAPPLDRHGIDLLRRELPEQVLPDGGHYERSPVYHLVVLRDLLEVQAVSPHSWIGDAIERMRAFAAALARPDGEPALFNDGGLDQAPRLELPDPPDGLVVFEDSGFAVVREGPLWLAFRCGPFAPDYPPGARARGRAVVPGLVGRAAGARGRGHVHVRAGAGARLVPGDGVALDHPGRRPRPVPAVGRLPLRPAAGGEVPLRARGRARGERPSPAPRPPRAPARVERRRDPRPRPPRRAEEAPGREPARAGPRAPTSGWSWPSTAPATAARSPAWVSERFGERVETRVTTVLAEARTPCASWASGSAA